ncbi:hypothetical protein [Rhizomonospora bruguierae]|uniref:hypothetical protein n=1 Tax=Rhizomonospora bruguierae TaxID=1581705 RepID=UPI001BCFBE39|nr:hypothetical protein [Micromonospora sp. NBRC 107566]
MLGPVRPDPVLQQHGELAQGAVTLTERHVGAGGAQSGVEHHRVVVAVQPRVMVGEPAPLAGRRAELAGGVHLLRLVRDVSRVEGRVSGRWRQQAVAVRRRHARVGPNAPRTRGDGPEVDHVTAGDNQCITGRFKRGLRRLQT